MNKWEVLLETKHDKDNTKGYFLAKPNYQF